MDLPSRIILRVHQSRLTKLLKVKWLAQKLLTVGLVVFYYDAVEQVPRSEVLTQNLKNLISFLFCQHFISMLPPHELPFNFSQVPGIMKIVSIGSMATYALISLLWPLFTWIGFGFTQLDTDYVSVRFFYYALYMIALNVVRLPCQDLVVIFIADGYLLSQITCMLLYNELSLSCLTFCIAPWIFYQVLLIALDVITYELEPTHKTCLVRLLGSHTSLFVMVMFAGYICLTALIDAVL